MADSEARSSFRNSLSEALATADLRRLLMSWTAVSVGTWTFFIVLSVYAYDQGGAGAVGVAALVRMVPAGLAAPVAGVIVDRSSRRDVLLVSTVGRALVLAVTAAAVAAEAPLALVFALGAVYTLLYTAHVPAQAALLPAIAETPRQIAASNAVFTSVDSAGFFAGSLLSGLLMAGTSMQTAFLVTAVLLALAAWPLTRIRRDPVPEYRAHEDEAEAERLVEELVSGFRTVAGDSSLRLLVGVYACSNFIEGAADVLVVLMALELLGLGDSGVGWLHGAWAIGGTAAGAAAISLLGRGRLAAGLAGGLVLAGLPLVVVAAAPEVPVAVAMLVILGSGYALIEIANLTLLQRLTSDDLLGRAFAVMESSYWIAGGVGAILAPPLVSLLGLRGALVAVGCCLPLLAVLRWASLARFEAGAVVPERAFSLLRHVQLFAPLPIGTIENLARRVRTIPVPLGAAIVREGEAGDRFYMISDGRFDVTSSGGRFPPLGEGDVFGEIALLHDVPRTATVTARTDSTVLALDRDSFLSAVGGHRYSARTAEGLATERKERAPTPLG